MNYALMAYLAWGFVPAYWKLLNNLPALEILCHRIIWAVAFYFLLMGWKRMPLRGSFHLPLKIWLKLLLSSASLFVNWYLYIYAVNAGYVIESSLGYFITPLLNVGLGVVILKERLTPLRWMSLGLAAGGVVLLSVQTSHLPWIALTLATSFAIYGLLRKMTPVDAIVGAQVEAVLMIPAALGVVLFLPTAFTGPHYLPQDWFFLIASGAVTGLPLVWFAQAAQLVPLNMMGFLQYLSPSIQLVLGILLFGEPFGANMFLGYGIIWVALAIFSYDILCQHRRAAQAPVIFSRR